MYCLVHHVRILFTLMQIAEIIRLWQSIIAVMRGVQRYNGYFLASAALYPWEALFDSDFQHSV